MARTLILGGIRSGKSRLAEEAVGSTETVTYVATAESRDGEMAERIRQHQACRPAHWGLVEEPLRLARVLSEQAGASLLIDCMSLWVSNLLHADEGVFEAERTAFLDALSAFPGRVVIVSNEVGLGTIGMDPLTRRYCDELGRLNQALAARCETVLMSVAGLPLVLKGNTGPRP